MGLLRSLRIVFPLSVIALAVLDGGRIVAQEVKDAKRATYLLIPIKGVIGIDFTATRMKALLEQATRLKPDVVVLELDTPGGAVEETERIVDLMIANKNLRFVAFVRKGLSAGATITLACPEIYVTESATIGAATSYQVGEDRLPAAVAEKMQSAWRAVCRKAADFGAHPSLLAEAMVDPDFVLRMRTAGGRIILERESWEQRHDQGEVLKARGRILTLTAREAVSCGLVKGVVADLAALGEQVGLPGWEQQPPAGTVEPRRPEGLSACQLYDLLMEKANSLSLFNPDATALKRDQGVKEWEAWLKQQRFTGRQVTWTMSVVQAGKAEINYQGYRSIDGLEGAIGRLEEELKHVTADAKSEKKKRLAEYNDELTKATTYPVLVNATCPDNPRVRITARVSKSAEETLAATPKGGEVTLTGTITDLRFGNQMDVTLDRCRIAPPMPAPKSVASPASPQPAPPDTPDVQAQKKLELALNYKAGGMMDKAKVTLQGILKDFPQTKAAQEAKRLLEEMGKGTPNPPPNR
jgi:ATP-dependent protease ClpP protease subunit